MQYEFVVVLCDCYFVCRWPSKYESQLFGATTAVMFEFMYQEYKLGTSFLSQYHLNLALKYDLSEKGH